MTTNFARNNPRKKVDEIWPLKVASSFKDLFKITWGRDAPVASSRSEELLNSGSK